jgi:predicted nicotinamide N-methyase
MEDDDGIDELYGVWAAMLTSTAAVVVANADTASNKEGEEENDDGDNPLHETRTLSPSPPSSQLLSASSSSSSSTTLEFRIGRFHGCCCDCDGQRQEGLRIRVFPFHNDLSLRLWEGGAVLSEFLLANPCLVQNRRVVELGSGTGLASLVSLLACGADRVVATDKSDRAVENLRHNFELNRSLVHSVASSPSSTWECRRYDWNDALDPREVDEDNNDDNDYGDVLISSQVLMAADVAYDDDMIPGLVEAIRRFFFEKEKGAATTATTTTTTEPLSNNGSGDNNKLAILATTRRNPATFTRLLQGLCRVLQLAEMDDAPLNDNDDYDVIGNDANNGNSASNEKSSLDFLELVLAVAGAGSEDGGNRKGILDGDVNALVGESCGGGECRAPPPPIAFPARFVQPRSDVSIFMIRPRQPTRSRGYCLNASTRMDDEGYLLLHNRPSHQRSGGGEEGDFSLRAS